MTIFEQQRDILFDACKKVATDKKCPPWIADVLKDAVIKAKNIKEEFPSFSDEADDVQSSSLQVGDIVVISANNTCCVAKLIEEQDIIDNTRLFDVQVVEGNKNHQKGTIFHNIPESFMRKK